MFNAGLSYDVFDWLSISGRVNVDNSEEKGTKKYYASTVRQLTELSDNGWYGESSQSNRQIYADAMLNINKTFNEDWSLNATLGASLQDVRADGRSISGPIRDGSIAGETALPSNVFNLYQISNAKTKKASPDGESKCNLYSQVLKLVIKGHITLPPRCVPTGLHNWQDPNQYKVHLPILLSDSL